MENKAAAGGLFESDSRLRDLGIFLERPGERGIEGDGVGMRQAKRAGVPMPRLAAVCQVLEALDGRRH